MLATNPADLADKVKVPPRDVTETVWSPETMMTFNQEAEDAKRDLSKQSQVKLLRLLESREYLPLGSDVKKKSNARYKRYNEKKQGMIDK